MSREFPELAGAPSFYSNLLLRGMVTAQIERTATLFLKHNGSSTRCLVRNVVSGDSSAAPYGVQEREEQ